MVQRFSVIHFVILLFMFVISSSTLSIPNIIMPYVKQSGWISSLIAMLLSLSLVPMYVALYKRYPDLSLIQCIQTILGKWFGSLVAFFYIFYFLLNTAGLMRQVAELIVTVLLPETPLLAILIVFFLIVSFSVHTGIENVARTARIFAPWVLIFFITLLLLLIPNINGVNLLPVMENGLSPILRGSFIIIGIPYLDLIMFLMLTPQLSSVKEVRMGYIIGILLGGSIMTLVVILAITTLGINVTADSNYPIYKMAQKINIGNFIQRLEAIIGVIWIITFFVKVSICFYTTVVGTAQLFYVKDYRSLIRPLTIVTIMCSIVFIPNMPYFFLYLSEYWSPQVIWVGLFIPLLLLVMDTVKKKRKSAQQPKELLK